MSPDTARQSEEPGNPAGRESRPRSAPSSQRKAAARATILIVDDVDDTRELYASYLRMAGYDVLTAHDGLTGVDTALRHNPDAIVMDLSMPGIDGVEATKRLKAQAGDLRVLILTAYPMLAIERGTLGAGADGFLTKPCLPEDLEIHLRRLLSRPPAAPDTTDAAKLAGLVRRLPRICTRCIGTKLNFSPEQTTAAIADLARTVAFEQDLGLCPICGRTQWIVTLTT